MPDLLEKSGPWTFPDLDEIPEGLWARWRFEIVDGGLEVSPAPRLRHEVVGANLAHALSAALRPALVPVPTVGLNLHPTYRIPDLVVLEATTAAYDVATVEPRDVLLAVEVVSPGSVTRDRITKPAEYAAAGIAGFWRVEVDDPLRVTAYALPQDSDVYEELGTWSVGERLAVDAPFAIELDVADLVP